MAKAVGSSEGAGQVEEADYEVSIPPAAFGMLRSLRTFGGSDLDPASSARCYLTIKGRRVPCADCPVAARLAVGESRTTARLLHPPSRAYEVVTATVVEPGRARVRLRRIAADAVAAIHDAKVVDLASRACLSDREGDVLRHLVLGRSIAEIAIVLQIRPRTVKFHQANILEKLGVDSRGELLRLLF